MYLGARTRSVSKKLWNRIAKELQFLSFYAIRGDIFKFLENELSKFILVQKFFLNP